VATVVSHTVSKAAEVDLIIQRGDDLAHIIGVVDSAGVLFPVTGYTATFQVYNNSEFQGSPVLTLSTAGGGVTVNGAAGQFTLVMTDTATNALGWSNGYYKFTMTSPGAVDTRIMQGEVSVL
jgi:hypothetical protein